MLWFLVTILAYFFLAVVALFDRYFLVGSIPNPKTYTFYVGVLWFFAGLFLIPFGIVLPVAGLIILGLVTGFIKIFANLFLYEGTAISEVSRTVPAVGGLLPIFSFVLFFLYFPKTEILNLSQFIAFICLVFGSILISLKKFSLKFLNFEILKYPVISAFLFALTFFLTKILFLKTNFLSGFFLILIGGGIGAISFLISRQFRSNIFSQKFNQKISGIFLVGQITGGIGAILQQYAFFLAKPNQVPLINALEGIIYVFLLFFVFILSFWKPHLLKEEMKGTTLFQKIFAILLIGMGLTILALEIK